MSETHIPTAVAVSEDEKVVNVDVNSEVYIREVYKGAGRMQGFLAGVFFSYKGSFNNKTLRTRAGLLQPFHHCSKQFSLDVLRVLQASLNEETSPYNGWEAFIIVGGDDKHIEVEFRKAKASAAKP